MKQYSYQIKDKKIGEIFTYNGNKYQVMEVTNAHSSSPYIIGCTIREPETGCIKSLCAFVDRCGSINRRHRGHCLASERKDNKTVYFRKL